MAGRSWPQREEIGIVLAAAIWVKVVATPTIGVITDRLGARPAVMGVLAATALVSYASLWSVGDFGVLVSLTLVALTAQSALIPLGDTVTLAISRLDGLDYGRIRFWGSVSFILASLVSGAVGFGRASPPSGARCLRTRIARMPRRSVAAASAQLIYASVSSGLGGGLVMLAAGALYARYGGRAYLFMAVLSAAGLLGAVGLRPPSSTDRNRRRSPRVLSDGGS